MFAKQAVFKEDKLVGPSGDGEHSPVLIKKRKHVICGDFPDLVSGNHPAEQKGKGDEEMKCKEQRQGDEQGFEKFLHGMGFLVRMCVCMGYNAGELAMTGLWGEEIKLAIEFQ